MRIFFDANILFSASKSEGAVRQFVELLLAADHECWADGFVSEEARRNLRAKAPEDVAALESLLSRIHVADAHPFDPAPESASVLPEKDRPVLAAAIRLNCEALVTGDRTHFGPLYGKTIGGVRILSPRSLAEALLK